MLLFHKSVGRKWDVLLPFVIFYIIIFDLDLIHARTLPSMKRTYHEGRPEEETNIDKSTSCRAGKDISKVNQLAYIELFPIGSSVIYNTTGNVTISNRLRGTLKQTPQNNRWAIKIYGDGVEHKFPPFLERIIQRIQTYFSIYKYTDTSSVEAITVENASDNNIWAENKTTSILFEDKTNYNVSLLSNDDNSLKEHLIILELQSTTQDDNKDYAQFLAIND